MTAPDHNSADDESRHQRLRDILEQQLRAHEEREREQQSNFAERMSLLAKLEEVETRRQGAKQATGVAKGRSAAVVGEEADGASRGVARDLPSGGVSPGTAANDFDGSTPLPENVDNPQVGTAINHPFKSASATQGHPHANERTVSPASMRSPSMVQLEKVRSQMKARNGGNLSMEQGKAPLVKPPRVPLEGTVGPPYLPLPLSRQGAGKGKYAAPVTKLRSTANSSRDDSEMDGGSVQEAPAPGASSFGDAAAAYAASLRRSQQESPFMPLVARGRVYTDHQTRDKLGTPQAGAWVDADRAYTESLRRDAQGQLRTASVEYATETAVAGEQTAPLIAPHERVDNGGRPLHPEFPTLLRLECGAYLELRCSLCGGNHSRKHADGSFISGLQGFQRHLSSAHGKGYNFEQVLRQCAYRRLGNHEVWAMLQKTAGAYKIEQVNVAAAEAGTSVTKPRQRQTFSRQGLSGKPASKKRKRKPMDVRNGSGDDETAIETTAQDENGKESVSDDELISKKRRGIDQC